MVGFRVFKREVQVRCESQLGDQLTHLYFKLKLSLYSIARASLYMENLQLVHPSTSTAYRLIVVTCYLVCGRGRGM